MYLKKKLNTNFFTFFSLGKCYLVTRNFFYTPQCFSPPEIDVLTNNMKQRLRKLRNSWSPFY